MGVSGAGVRPMIMATAAWIESSREKEGVWVAINVMWMGLRWERRANGSSSGYD